jgi:hypothetical protein
VLLINTRTGATVDPLLVDRATGRPIREPDYAFAAGPAAGARTRQRYGPANRRAVPAEQHSAPPNRKRQTHNRRAK